MDSPLRRLAKDYFEGRLDRSQYVAQRQQLIAELPDAAEPGGQALLDSQFNSSSAVEAPVGEGFSLASGGCTSSEDLVSALAGREAEAALPMAGSAPVLAPEPGISREAPSGAAIQEGLVRSATQAEDNHAGAKTDKAQLGLRISMAMFVLAIGVAVAMAFV